LQQRWQPRRPVSDVGASQHVGRGFIQLIGAPDTPRAQRIMSRARGQVRSDPQLGTLIRNVEAEAWDCRG
jgi:hypothetical protein